MTLPLRGTFTYRDPRRGAAPVAIGTQVVVPFGPRTVTGFVVAHAAAASPGGELRDIEEIVAGEPAFDEAMVAFCRWVADYYYAPFGEVLRAALPHGEKADAVRGRPHHRARAGCRGRRQRSLLGEETGHPVLVALVGRRRRADGEGARAGRAARAVAAGAARQRRAGRGRRRGADAPAAAHRGVRRRGRGRHARAALREGGGEARVARAGRRGAASRACLWPRWTSARVRTRARSRPTASRASRSGP